MSDLLCVEDVLGFEGVDVVVFVECVCVMVGEDVDVWDEKCVCCVMLVRMMMMEEGFDVRAYFVAAYGERTREELVRGVMRLEVEIDVVWVLM